jgi:hypothetical protein
MINGYELGQFLRIIMWIFVPVGILSMLVTTWLHYRRRRRDSDEIVLSIQGFGEGKEEFVLPLQMSGKSSRKSDASAGSVAPAGSDTSAEEDGEYKETVYKGILWMKEKYEQYRDMSDRRYDRLKEQLARSEKKYDDLLASIVEVKVGDRREQLLTGTALAQVEERAVLEEEDRGPELGGESSGYQQAEADDAATPTVSTMETEGTDPVAAKPEIRPMLANAITASEIERNSLRDLLAERNQQIVFLQRQLDQRIKDFHLAEHEGRGARGQIQELEEQAARTRQRLEEEVDRIRHQLDDEIVRGRRQLEEQTAESKRQLEEHVANAERKLEEKQRVIAELEEQIHVLRQKIEELVDKLRNNSQLLLNIYQELDKSLRSTDVQPQP